MLSQPLALEKINASEIIDYLYKIFHRDFIAEKTYLANKMYINPRSHKKENGKELDFWHLITRKQTEKVWEKGKLVLKCLGRYPDYGRAARLEWIKQILTLHDQLPVRVFYHRENNPKRDVRLYMWAFNANFVFILQRLGRNDSFLVTSFYIDHEDKKKQYSARYANYIKGDSNLTGCEWF